MLLKLLSISVAFLGQTLSLLFYLIKKKILFSYIYYFFLYKLNALKKLLIDQSNLYINKICENYLEDSKYEKILTKLFFVNSNNEFCLAVQIGFTFFALFTSFLPYAIGEYFLSFDYLNLAKDQWVTTHGLHSLQEIQDKITPNKEIWEAYYCVVPKDFYPQCAQMESLVRPSIYNYDYSCHKTLDNSLLTKLGFKNTQLNPYYVEHAHLAYHKYVPDTIKDASTNVELSSNRLYSLLFNCGVCLIVIAVADITSNFLTKM